MTNRRGFLKGLLALPLLGFFKAEKALGKPLPLPSGAGEEGPEARIVRELNRRLSIHDKVRLNTRYSAAAVRRQKMTIFNNQIDDYYVPKPGQDRTVIDSKSKGFYYESPEWVQEYKKLEKEYPNGVPFKPIEVVEEPMPIHNNTFWSTSQRNS